jgi:hypothetical protein
MPRPALSLVASRPLTKVNAGPVQMSLAGQGRAVDPALLKQVLAANWSRVCMLAFPDDVDAGAAFFAVTGQCFRNWLAGDVCRPSGHHVTLAVLRFGPVVADLLAEGATSQHQPQLRQVA